MRRQFVALALLLLSSVGARPALTGTHLSFWKNSTKCSFEVTGNGDSKQIAANSTYDFGAFSKKDPEEIVVKAEESCGVALKSATISWKNPPGPWKCLGRGKGPYVYRIRRTIDNPEKPFDFCYCINLSRVAYIDVDILNDGVMLQYTDSIDRCVARVNP